MTTWKRYTPGSQHKCNFPTHPSDKSFLSAGKGSHQTKSRKRKVARSMQGSCLVAAFGRLCVYGASSPSSIIGKNERRGGGGWVIFRSDSQTDRKLKVIRWSAAGIYIRIYPCSCFVNTAPVSLIIWLFYKSGRFRSIICPKVKK